MDEEGFRDDMVKNSGLLSSGESKLICAVVCTMSCVTKIPFLLLVSLDRDCKRFEAEIIIL